MYNNIIDASRGIIRERGPMGLYRGLGVTLVEIIPYAALQFGIYDMLTSAWRVSDGRVGGERHGSWQVSGGRLGH